MPTPLTPRIRKRPMSHSPNPIDPTTADHSDSNSPTASISFRRATVDDIHAVFDFLSPFMERQQILTRTPEQVAALLPYSQLAFAEHDVVVGFVAVEIYSHKLAEIQCLCVAADYQRQGIGKQLVRFCIEVTREEGILELMAISASDRFLMDCGFDYSLPGQKRALFIQPQETMEE